MFFEYLKTTQYQDSIDIDSIGNCYLQTINDEADSWVLLINTELGSTTIIQAGPINLDFDEVSKNVYILKQSFEYNEKKLYKIISEFINNPKRTITCVEIIDKDFAKNILDKIAKSL